MRTDASGYEQSVADAVATERERIAAWLEAKAGDPFPVSLRTAAEIIRKGLPPEHQESHAASGYCGQCGSNGHPTYAHPVPGGAGIPVPGLDPARLRCVCRDGSLVYQLRCPRCRHWGDIDDDQLHGRVSIDHTGQGCTFHETHDLWGMVLTPGALAQP